LKLWSDKEVLLALKMPLSVEKSLLRGTGEHWCVLLDKKQDGSLHKFENVVSGIEAKMLCCYRNGTLPLFSISDSFFTAIDAAGAGSFSANHESVRQCLATCITCIWYILCFTDYIINRIGCNVLGKDA
jgi:hypothetical protein